MRFAPTFAIIFIFFLFPKFAKAKDFSYNLDFAFENLNFIPHRNNHPINDQEGFDFVAELIYENQKNLKIDLKPRLRVDFLDSSRNRYIPNEAYLLWYGDRFELTGGLMIKNWGVAIFYNPTDVLNRKDLQENGYTPETLGDLMVSAKVNLGDLGLFSDLNLEAIVLPFFQKMPLPENDMRFAIKGQSGLIAYQKDTVQDSLSYLNSLGFALRSSATLKSFDFSLLYYHGPEHNPGFYFTTNSPGALRLRPFYYTVDSLGFNAEAVLGKFIFRLETALKLTSSNAFKTHKLAGATENVIPSAYFQFIPGLSYDVENFLGAARTLTLNLEYLGEDNHQSNILKEMRPFKNDIYIGLRYLFNNTRLTQVELGVVKDLSNSELISILDLSSKLVGNLKWELQGVLVNRSGNLNQPLSFFDNNSYFMTRFSYAFGGRF